MTTDEKGPSHTLLYSPAIHFNSDQQMNCFIYSANIILITPIIYKFITDSHFA